jgi:predicted GIY-YIG superfamily endonuclease
MTIGELVPQPTNCESFLRSRNRFVPETSGCYVLTTFLTEILYLGLATNLRKRMIDHLDSPEKTSPTEKGRAVLFHWVETKDINTVERTWMNIHIQHEGKLPLLNKAYSPVSI